MRDADGQTPVWRGSYAGLQQSSGELIMTHQKYRMRWYDSVKSQHSSLKFRENVLGAEQLWPDIITRASVLQYLQ